ncbi:glutaredoxin-1 [Endogone sp. FLAS-F59071]|nr:glutaredoxin-1 [Endogone sp. FLAS-F59071]|eukprot:RUS16114.1 glutaredoxin-1 [Endogone sp. FLAS-F59071]
MASPKDIVEKHINDNFIVVFSKSYCPYCRKAKATLTELGQQYFAIELDEIENGNDIQQYLAQKTSQRTVPNIFIREQHVGGCDDLLAKKSDGTLEKLLAAQ